MLVSAAVVIVEDLLHNKKSVTRVEKKFEEASQKLLNEFYCLKTGNIHILTLTSRTAGGNKLRILPAGNRRRIELELQSCIYH